MDPRHYGTFRLGDKVKYSKYRVSGIGKVVGFLSDGYSRRIMVEADSDCDSQNMGHSYRRTDFLPNGYMDHNHNRAHYFSPDELELIGTTVVSDGNLYPLGTMVKFRDDRTHGIGKIVGYESRNSNSYIIESSDISFHHRSYVTPDPGHLPFDETKARLFSGSEITPIGGGFQSLEGWDTTKATDFGDVFQSIDAEAELSRLLMKELENDYIPVLIKKPIITNKLLVADQVSGIIIKRK